MACPCTDSAYIAGTTSCCATVLGSRLNPSNCNASSVELTGPKSARAEAPSHHASGLSSGLSRALCYINSTVKAMAERAPAKPRLLCIMGCPDDSRQYIAVMNAIFSAQVRAVRLHNNLHRGEETQAGT